MYDNYDIAIVSVSTYPQLVSLVTVEQDLSVIGDLLDVGPVVVEAHVTHQENFTCQCNSLLSIKILDNNDNVLTVREVAGEPAVHGHAGGGGPGPVAEHAGGGVIALQLVSVLIKQNLGYSDE